MLVFCICLHIHQFFGLSCGRVWGPGIWELRAECWHLDFGMDGMCVWPARFAVVGVKLFCLFGAFPVTAGSQSRSDGDLVGPWFLTAS